MNKEEETMPLIEAFLRFRAEVDKLTSKDFSVVFETPSLKPNVYEIKMTISQAERGFSRLWVVK